MTGLDKAANVVSRVRNPHEMLSEVTHTLCTLAVLMTPGLLWAAHALPARRLPAPDASGYRQIVTQRYPENGAGLPPAIALLLTKSPSQVANLKGRSWQIKGGLLEYRTKRGGAPTRLDGKDGLPVHSLTGIAAGGDGSLWLASKQGVVLFRPAAPEGSRWYFFAGKRYLEDDEVLGLAAGTDDVWVRTRGGISHVAFQPFTLEQKSRYFLDRIQQRHVRYGYVADCDLVRPGDLTSFRPVPHDNDGLWTSMYLASEAFRYRATGSKEALDHVQTSLHALLRLLSITGIPGFPARSLMKKGDYRDPSGEWHWTPDGRVEWKGDTSSDELVGHFFAYWIAYNLLTDETDRAAIRTAVASIAGGLLEHDWHLLGYGGRVTRWGRYDREHLAMEEGGDRALDALELISHLSVAYWITGDKKFLDATHRVQKDMNYMEEISHFGEPGTGEVNYSDEQLVFLTFYPLLDGEKSPELHQAYVDALTKEWKHVRAEQNPLWAFMYAQGTGAKQFDAATAVERLEHIPMSTITWTVQNSQRDDLTPAPSDDRRGRAQALRPIPAEAREGMKWIANPFQLDGGKDGRAEDEGTFFLLPYWFGRSYHLFPAASRQVSSR